MSVSESDSEVTDTLVSEYLRAVDSERCPSTYRWYVTDVVFSDVYDETTPVCRVDAVNGLTYSQETVVFYTRGGAVDVVADNGALTDGEYGGEVVIREFDGDAVLVRYTRTGSEVYREHDE